MKTCKACIHNYHCPMPQEGYNFNPDVCPYKPNYSTLKVKKEYVSPKCTVEEEKQNKKDFIKEVMEEVQDTKKSLYDFLIDRDSYKQFRDCCDNAFFEIDFDKIHRAMKVLNWTWCTWVDFDYNEHTGTVPSVFGIKQKLREYLITFEKWVMKNPERKAYFTSCGGWEIEAKVEDYNPDLPDDWDNRVYFNIRFVLESFDNCI